MDMIRRIKGVCLAMVSLSVATVGVLVAMAWITLSMHSQHSPTRDPPNWTGRMESTQSCESLRTFCGHLAGLADAQHAHIAFLDRGMDDLLKRIAILVGGWVLGTSA